MKEDGIERKGEHLSDQWDVGLDNEALEVDMRAILRAQEHLNKALHTHALPCLRQLQEHKQHSNRMPHDISTRPPLLQFTVP